MQRKRIRSISEQGAPNSNYCRRARLTQTQSILPTTLLQRFLPSGCSQTHNAIIAMRSPPQLQSPANPRRLRPRPPTKFFQTPLNPPYYLDSPSSPLPHRQMLHQKSVHSTHTKRTAARNWWRAWWLFYGALLGRVLHWTVPCF